MGDIINKKDEILAEIEDKLKEEKWTRAAIESYSVKNFVEMDNYIRVAVDEKFKEELKTLCKEHLKITQNSVVGLYLVGVLSLEESSVDDTHLPQIIKIFSDANKNKIAEFLAEKILTYRENKFALKTLEAIYEEQDLEDELFNIKKRLVLIDSKDAYNANYLGEYYEKEGDKDMAMFYYRLAVERYIKSRSVKMVEEIWNRMIKISPDDLKFIITIAKKIREVLGDEKVGTMVFDDVAKNLIKAENYKDALKMLKLVVDFKPHDKQVRKAIESCYRNIYSEHSQLEKYLKTSAIGQSWKPHKEAIRQFETHIAFDKDSYVMHKSWGIGLVKELNAEEVIIDFEGKPNHRMTLKIALRALSVLEEDNIVIWKHFKAEELKTMAWENPLQVLEFILKNSGGEAASKDLKLSLVPDVIGDKEWNKWWVLAKKRMEDSNTVVQSLTKRNVIELRDTEVTITEELVSKFKKATSFDNKVKLYIDFVNRGGDVNEEVSSALPQYFLEIVKASSESPDRRLLSLIALKYGRFEGYKEGDIDPAVIFGVKDLQEIYSTIDIDLRQAFLDILENKLKDWDIRYSEFILNTPFSKYHNVMLKRLINYEKFEIVNNIFVSIMNSFQETPDLFIWITRLVMDEQFPDLQENIGIRPSELVYRLISLIDIINHEIESKTNVGLNKKVVTAINDILFKKKKLEEFVVEADESSANTLISLLHMTDTLDKDLGKKYSDMIIEKYPELKKAPRVERVNIRHPFLVTKASYNNKQNELKHLVNVEIPANSHAIGEAMEKGDLRENAEYKAALEKQDQLKATTSKLESELGQAKLLTKEMVDVSIVDVGTLVNLKKSDGEVIGYQILGQWSVNPEKGILS